MDIRISTRFRKTSPPSPELRRDAAGKAARLSGRLIATFERMSEEADTFTLAHAEALVEKLLYACPDDVEWSLRLHRRDEAEPPHDFNAALMFAMRALRDAGSWMASFDLHFAVDMTPGRDVIRRARLDARRVSERRRAGGRGTPHRRGP